MSPWEEHWRTHGFLALAMMRFKSQFRNRQALNTAWNGAWLLNDVSDRHTARQTKVTNEGLSKGA
eukprot:3198243-Amphidinium_carterae.1